jgi:hypothetical protein
MHRIAVVVAVIAVVLAGCAAAQTEAEKKREAFRLSHVPQTHRSRYLKANALIKDGDHYLREGMTALEQKNKIKYLSTAASKYSKAVNLLNKILAKTEDPTDRKFISHVIEDTQTNLREAVDLQPILDR